MLTGGQSKLVCIDEVQVAYHKLRTDSEDFWNQLKRLERGQTPHSAAHDTRVVMAAAYGPKLSAPSDFMSESPAATPVGFDHPDTVVTIFPNRSGATLQLSDAEWDELWASYLRVTGLQLDDLIKGHLASICLGQVGLCMGCALVHVPYVATSIGY